MCITYSEDINSYKSLLESIPLPKNQPTTIISDNTAAIDSALSVLPRGSVQALCAWHFWNEIKRRKFDRFINEEDPAIENGSKLSFYHVMGNNITPHG